MSRRLCCGGRERREREGREEVRQLWRVHSVLPSSPSPSSCRASALPPDHLGAGRSRGRLQGASASVSLPLLFPARPRNLALESTPRREAAIGEETAGACARVTALAAVRRRRRRAVPRVAATALRPTELSHFRTGEIPPPLFLLSIHFPRKIQM